MKIGFSLNSIRLCPVCCRSHLDYFPPPDPSWTWTSEYLHNYILRNKIKAVQLSWHLTLTHLWPGLHACPHLASQAIRGGYTGRPIPGVTSPQYLQRSPVLLLWGSECCDTLCCAMAQRSQDRVTPPGLALAEPRAIAVDEPSRHHLLLILRKHRRELQGEGNSLGIFPTSSGTHRNIPRSPRSDSGKNNCRNVISWNTVKSRTSRGKCYVTV